MAVLVQEGNLALRTMEETEADLRLFLQWMTDPQTMKYWDGMTEIFDYDRVCRHYREHMEEGVTPCFIVLDGEAIGYLQFCEIPDAEANDLPPEEYARFVRDDEKVFGIDLFIGRADLRGKGIGTRLLKMTCRLLFEQYGADHITIDPKSHNARAIRCYEKVGFQHYFVAPQRELQDGVYYDNCIMGLLRGDEQLLK